MAVLPVKDLLQRQSLTREINLTGLESRSLRIPETWQNRTFSNDILFALSYHIDKRKLTDQLKILCPRGGLKNG